MTFGVGSRLGPYELVAPLGVGGMGEVYRARDSRLKRDVALKLLPDSFATDPDRRARFEREAQTLAALNHPHIAQIYGLEDRAIVMELVEGDTLAERIAGGAIPFDAALEMARQIADALDAAHEAGIVHRDLKPANVKVRPDGTVKVLDFGLAKAMEPAAVSMNVSQMATITTPAMTQAGVILGTAAYMSPEQARGKPVDQRADIWAFGVVLYEMLTGSAAFSGETVTDVLAAVVTKDVDLSAAPAQVRRLLAACLEKNPRRRLRNIGDACRLLEGQQPAPIAAARSGTGARVALGIAGISLGIAAGLAYLHFTEPQPAADVMRLQIAVPAEATPDAAFSLSPDGRRLVFIGVEEAGRTRLWVRALDDIEARPLPGTEQVGSGSVFWSPDGRWLAFATQGRLRKLDMVDGGAPQVVADISGGAGVIGGAWSRNDVLVFGSNIGTRRDSGGMFRVSASGGTVTPVTALDPSRQEDGHRHPHFLPDGRHFLYLRRSADPRLSGIFVGDVDAAPDAQSTEPALATTAGPAFFVPSSRSGGSGHLVYVREGAARSLAFDAGTFRTSGQEQTIVEPVGTFLDRALLFVTTAGTLIYTTAAPVLERQLTWFDASGKATGTVGAPAELDGVRVSPDGRQAVVERSERGRGVDRNLWVVDFARERMTRVTFPPIRGVDAIWSADGSRVIFGSGEGRMRSRVLYRKAATGAGEAEVLLESGDFVGPTSVSRDGRFLFYTLADKSTGEDLWVLPLEGDRKPFPLLQTPLAERGAMISPDGRWVAYEEVDRLGRSSVYVRPFSPSPASQPSAATKWLVSSDGGSRPQWLSNGRRLSYATGDAGQLSQVMVVDVIEAPTFEWERERPLMPIPDGTTFFDIAEDGPRLLAGIPQVRTTPRPPLNVILNFNTLLSR